VSARTDLFLAIIAVATLASAIVQVGVIVVAGLLVRRVNRLANQVEQELKPLFTHLNAIGRDASRAASLAVAQVERVDRLLGDFTQKIEQTLNTVQATIAAPAREGLALLSALRAAIDVLREKRGRARQRSAEEEDALFI
jgi:predicted PurR-regulated permease PerM